jgi:hypothetical protein
MTEQTNLTRLMQISTALGRQCSLPNVLRTLLDGIQTFNLSRVRLYSVSMEQKILIGWTKSGREADFIGRVFFVSKDPYVSAVLAEPLPQIFQRRPGDPISIEHDILNAAVAEWLLMPLV